MLIFQLSLRSKSILISSPARNLFVAILQCKILQKLTLELENLPLWEKISFQTKISPLTLNLSFFLMLRKILVCFLVKEQSFQVFEKYGENPLPFS